MARYFTRKYTKEEVEKLLNAVENIISKIEKS
jgi:hypothetical protein